MECLGVFPLKTFVVSLDVWGENTQFLGFSWLKTEQWPYLFRSFVTPLTSAPVPGVLQTRGINLSCIRTCVVVAEERPRIALQLSFSKLFKDIGLSPRAVSTTFGSRVNVAICLQVTVMKSRVVTNGGGMCGAPEQRLRSLAAWCEPWFHLLPVGLWAFYLDLLGLILLICKVKIIVSSFTGSFCRITELLGATCWERCPTVDTNVNVYS